MDSTVKEKKKDYIMSNAKNIANAMRDNNTFDLIAGIRAIDNGNDLNAVIDAVNAQMKRISRMQATKFRVGDTVTFSSRRGFDVVGTVTKVNQKTICVDSVNGFGNFRVDASLLTKVDKEGA